MAFPVDGRPRLDRGMQDERGVLRLREGVGEQRLQAPGKALVYLHLKSVVPGFRIARALIDDGDVRREREVRPPLVEIARTRQRHVDVAADEDVLAACSHVRHVEHGRPGELALNARVEHVRHVRLVAGREEEHREPWRRSDRRRERYRRESRQPVADAAERRELILRLQVDLLEQRMVAFECPAVGAEVVAIVADAIRAANRGTAIVGRIRNAETRRPATVEVRRQWPAIVVRGHVNQSVLQAEVGLPVVLLDRAS